MQTDIDALETELEKDWIIFKISVWLRYNYLHAEFKDFFLCNLTVGCSI